jgi:YaiO family outer membrane protein
MKSHCQLGLIVISILLTQGRALAQQTLLDPQSAEQAPIRELELSTRYDNLSDNFGNWRDVSVRGTALLGDHLIQAELSSQQHFRTRGNFAGLSDTYTFSPDWYGSLAVGAGNGSFFLPQYRVDAFLNKKWFAKKNLVTYVGYGRYRAPDGHVDRSGSLGFVYYFGIPLVLEAGIRRNISDPGAVSSAQKYVAASYGQQGEHLVVARHGWGTEGYLPFAPGSNLVGYASRETTLSWRQRLSRRSGVGLELHHYENSLFRRTGAALTLFHDF